MESPVPAPESVPLQASGRARALGWFVLAVGVSLGVDLGVKSWSFARVAGEPVVLTSENASDPSVNPVPAHAPVPVVPYVLSLRLTVNRGAVFGLGQGKRWVFVVVSVAAVGLIGRLFWRSDPGAWGTHLALALILSGALGNLYDRLRFGAVRDMCWLFPDVHLPLGLAWPGGQRDLYPWIFNVADAALVVGVSLMAWLLHRQDRAEASGSGGSGGSEADAQG